MKENLRRLQLIFRITRLKPDMFYSIRFDSYGITLQGKSDVVSPLCNELNFVAQDFDTRHHHRKGTNLILVAK